MVVVGVLAVAVVVVVVVTVGVIVVVVVVLLLLLLLLLVVVVVVVVVVGGARAFSLKLFIHIFKNLITLYSFHIYIYNESQKVLAISLYART